MTSSRTIFAALLLMASAVAQTPCQQPSAAAAEQAPAVVKDFEQRVQQYVDGRKKAQPGNPPQNTSAKKLTDYRDKLRANVIATRGEAKQGDVFTPEIATYF